MSSKMEAVEETSKSESAVDVAKQTEVSEIAPVPAMDKSLVCMKSNGVSEELDSANSEVASLIKPINSETITVHTEPTFETTPNETKPSDEVHSALMEVEPVLALNPVVEPSNTVSCTVNVDVVHVQTEVEVYDSNNENVITLACENQQNNLNTCNDITQRKNEDEDEFANKVKFETEVFVKEEEVTICNYETNTDDNETTNHILSQLEGQTIDLGDVLRSASTPDCSENNNSFNTKQVLNKEELLDILEGKDIQKSNLENTEHNSDEVRIQISDTPVAKLALQQLSKLKVRRCVKSKKSTQCNTEKKTTAGEVNTKKRKQSNESIVKFLETTAGDVNTKKRKQPNESIVKVLETTAGEVNTKKRKQSNESIVKVLDTTVGEVNTKKRKQSNESIVKVLETTAGEVNTKKQKQSNESIVKVLEPTVGEVNTKKQKQSNESIVKVLEPTVGEVNTKKQKQSNESIVKVLEPTVGEVNTKKRKQSNESIVKVLERDWEDDVEDDKAQQVDYTSVTTKPDNISEKKTALLKDDKDTASLESSLGQLSEDSQSHSPGVNKSCDESQPQRRAGRVIKRKVIFDPDNFEKAYSRKPKVEEAIKVHPIKKVKSEQSIVKSESKSSSAKATWKKPQLKASKQNKRLSEVDRLLMDEGAVNMIYQLTSEASKGKKNMKKKAELIKKLNQSITPDKEMKFRERRKDTKLEESEARRIIGGKQRLSLSSSVKSPAVCEDVEAHSADDSIIYRRHSSSSYSSTCMSPRRLSEVDSVMQVSSKSSKQIMDTQETAKNDSEINVFLGDTKDPTDIDMIDKKDCISIKEKLNSKLSRALNIKRKKDSTKPEKLPKQKKPVVKSEVTFPDFHQLSITFSDNVAEICVHDNNTNKNVYNIAMLNELSIALEVIENVENVSVTLLSSQSGNVCSALNLNPLINDKLEQRKNYANELANSIRSFVYAVERHNKLLAVGVAGACEGLALATLALSDVAVASDRATFAFSAGHSAAPLMPGVAVLTLCSDVLPKSLVDEMVVFGRQLSAAEALQRGLVSRTLWPDRFRDELHAIVRDIAAQPIQTLLFKKRLLTLKRRTYTKSSFKSCVDAECDLLVQYWTSEEGQEALRAHRASN